MTTRPLIAIIGAGGTISSLATGNRDYMDYPETGRKLSVHEVIERIPELADVADLLPLTFRSVGSSAVGPDDWLRLHATIVQALADNPAITGVVILHGTATLEETAWFLSLTLPARLPVVLVGAQRPLNTLSSDAQANAVNALRVAADPGARGRGVMVVLNDQIHGARAVTKGSTFRLDAFHSPALGPIGVADPDRVVFHVPPPAGPGDSAAFALPPDGVLPRVDILHAYAGNDGVMVRACLAAGAAGLVSAGFAPGMPPTLEREALLDASRAGIPVVQASRVGSGRVARRGSIAAHRWIAASDLSPVKARILLMLALTRTTDPDLLQQIFDTH